MKPGRLNILEEKVGARWTLGVNLRDADGALVDLTGWRAELKVKWRADSPNVLLAASSEGGTIVLGGDPYNVVVDVDLALPAGRYVYDLVAFDAENRKWPVVTGRFEVEASTV